MLRALSVVAVTAGATFALGGCGSSESSGSKSASAPKASLKVKAPAEISQAGRLTACADISFPPMEYFESGSSTPTGFDVTLADAVGKAWGVGVAFKNTSFDGLLPAMASGRCDIVWSAIFVTSERTKRYAAVPYYKTARVLLVAKGNPKGITSPDDLAGKTVATEAGTSYVKSLQQLRAKLQSQGKSLNLQTYPKASDAAQQLIVGRADAVLTQDTEAAYREKSSPGKFEVGYTYPADDTFGVYLKKNDAQLKTALSKAFAELKTDGTLAKLATQWNLSTNGFSAITSPGS